ncbi:MAG: ImmA/IrrE family metallo-endopeptidase [Chloroflexi bacterium]|nr:ImmA/IrrE family metallo-endopeptidase [Chloroflexota bacterium]
MQLRRGFKTESATLVKDIRVELGLNTLQGLDPLRLASHLNIPVVPLTELSIDTALARFFLHDKKDVFSALTVFDGYRRMILHNDSHSPARQNSNLAHELAHALLFHEPTPAVDRLTGCRDWNEVREQEAAWLGGELLVSSDMALAVARGRLTRQQAKQRCGVSEKMLNWRLYHSGAIKRAERERARRRHSSRRPHSGRSA